jgi:outer membrane cobalamin receptor
MRPQIIMRATAEAMEVTIAEAVTTAEVVTTAEADITEAGNMDANAALLKKSKQQSPLRNPSSMPLLI